MTVKEYFKCLKANRLVSGGMILLGATTGFMYFNPPEEEEVKKASQIILLGSAAVIIANHGGSITYETYKRTQNKIKRYNTIPDNFVEYNSKTLNARIGLELAAKEKGLSHLLEN